MGILKVLLRYTLPVFVVLFGIGGCFFLFQSRPESAQKPPKPPAALVETAKAVKQPVTFRVQSQGSVSPRTQTTLIPEVSGEIVQGNVPSRSSRDWSSSIDKDISNKLNAIATNITITEDSGL